MTTPADNPSPGRAPAGASTEPPFWESAYNPRIANAFAWYVRTRMLAKKFTAVRLARGSADHLRALDAHDGPVVALRRWDFRPPCDQQGLTDAAPVRS